jgi:hypothetical protein
LHLSSEKPVSQNVPFKYNLRRYSSELGLAAGWAPAAAGRLRWTRRARRWGRCKSRTLLTPHSLLKSDWFSPNPYTLGTSLLVSKVCLLTNAAMRRYAADKVMARDGVYGEDSSLLGGAFGNYGDDQDDIGYF